MTKRRCVKANSQPWQTCLQTVCIYARYIVFIASTRVCKQQDCNVVKKWATPAWHEEQPHPQNGRGVVQKGWKKVMVQGIEPQTCEEECHCAVRVASHIHELCEDGADRPLAQERPNACHDKAAEEDACLKSYQQALALKWGLDLQIQGMGAN